MGDSKPAFFYCSVACCTSHLEVVNQSPGLLQLFTFRLVGEHVELKNRVGSRIHAQKQNKARFVPGQSERGQPAVSGLA